MIGCSQVKKASDHVPSNSKCTANSSCSASGAVCFPNRASFAKEGSWHPIGFVWQVAREGISCQCLARGSTRFCSFEPPIPCSSCEAVGHRGRWDEPRCAFALCTESVGGLPSVNPGALAALLIVLVFLSSFCTDIPQRDSVRYVNYLGCVGQVNTVQSLCIV